MKIEFASEPHAPNRKMESEPVILEEADDVDDVDIDELCIALRKSTEQIASLYNDTYMQFRGMRKKLREEMTTMDKQPLRPKSNTKKWLVKHGLAETSSFHEFFGKVCDELAKEHRLDISHRTVLPNKEIAKLFQVPVDEPIHIIDFIKQAPELFR